MGGKQTFEYYVQNNGSPYPAVSITTPTASDYTVTPVAPKAGENNCLQGKSVNIPAQGCYLAYSFSPKTDFSGDDFTTSPKDELYLRDVASAARSLKESGLPVKIVFRRCPVDFSERYAAVISEYSDVIVEVPPLWKRIGDGWNTILPMTEFLSEGLTRQVKIIKISDQRYCTIFHFCVQI